MIKKNFLGFELSVKEAFLMKRFFFILVIAIMIPSGLFGQVNEKKHCISTELSFAGGSVRYDYLLSQNISIGANAYINVFVLDFGGVFGFPMDLGISFIGCFYPTNSKFGKRNILARNFFFELGIGYGSNLPLYSNRITDNERETKGLSIIPGFGWKFTTIQPRFGSAHFFFTPGIKFPIILGNQNVPVGRDSASGFISYEDKFGIGLGAIIYCGLGVAF